MSEEKIQQYLKFSKTEDFKEFFVNSLLTIIDSDKSCFSTLIEKIGLDAFFDLREINKIVIELLLKFTFNSQSLGKEDLIKFVNLNQSDKQFEKVFAEVHPHFIVNLDKFVLIKNKNLGEINSNEVRSFKTNIDLVYSHQNLFKVDKAKLILELFTTDQILSKDNPQRNIYEFDQEQLEYLLYNLKQAYLNVK